MDSVGGAADNEKVSYVRPSVAAFCVTAGIVLAEFSVEAQPVGYLVRPLVAAVVLSVVVGLAVSFLGRASVVAAVFLAAWITQPGSPVALGLALLVTGLIVYRLVRSRTFDVDKPLLIGAAVFLLAGVVPVVPLISWSTPTRAEVEGTPTYLVLLDGYPRADTLAALGVDISPFLDELEARGFDLYPDATSRYGWTYRTLTLMTTGQPMTNDDWGSAGERKAARDSWRLPDGFVAVAPPAGYITIPGVPVLNPGGPTLFEAELAQDSALAGWFGGWIMDGFRDQLNRSLEILGSADEPMVFAHLLAPHTPFLYDAHGRPMPPPKCWPDCVTMEIRTDKLGITVDEWAAGIGAYLGWLNLRLIETIDQLVARHPDVEIVLFSDHGGRFLVSDQEEWHQTFLAARTPTRPGLFANSPHPDSILTTMGYFSSHE
jgi:hypothetical protein